MQESQEMQVWSLGQEDLLKEEMTTHSSILARRIPWTEEPGRLQSMGSQRVEYDWSDLVQHKTKEFSALNSLKPLSYFMGHFLPYKSTFLYFFFWPTTTLWTPPSPLEGEFRCFILDLTLITLISVTYCYMYWDELHLSLHYSVCASEASFIFYLLNKIFYFTFLCILSAVSGTQ